MNTLKKFDCFTAGLAIFAMFFGAGNIIFPLAIGQMALDKTPWGLAGFLVTAVAMPFAGLLAMFRYKGQIKLFFNRFGKIPGLVIASLIIALLGPFGAAPRCIALAHSTLTISVPGIPLFAFSAAASVLIFLFVYKEHRFLKWLGYVLSPLKIGLLVWIIIKGYMEAPHINMISAKQSEIFHLLHGLKEGYNTMDLLAAFFFAPIIISSFSANNLDKNLNRFILKSSVIGASLLSAIYIGFCYLARFYAAELTGISSDQLLGTIAIKILGPHAGLIVGITVGIACLTTAMALVAAFTNFIHQEIAEKKLSSIPILVLTLLTTFLVTTLEFRGIAQVLSPILETCYPVLILLTFYNLFAPARSSKENKTKGN